MSVVGDLLDLLAERPPTLGAGRLVGIDGPAGSGKTTLARALVTAFDDRERTAGRGTGARLVHMDDLYEGWAGLGAVDAQLDTLLRPLAGGAPGRYRRFDWHAGDWAGTVPVPPGPLLVVEGVGSGGGRFDDLRTLLVWVEAPYDERLRRGLERDGDTFAPHWDQWARDEHDLFTRERTRERADVVVDGTAAFDEP